MSIAKTRKSFLTFAILLAYVLIWEICFHLFSINKELLPAPSLIISDIWGNISYFNSQTLFSVKIIFFGFLSSIIIAPLLAFLVYKIKIFNRLIMPLILSSQVMPKTALIPLFIIWFEYSSFANFLITFLISFYPIFSDTLLGCSMIKKEYYQMMKMFRANKLEILLKLELPFSAPYILSSFKTAALYSVIGAITSEIILSKEGVGYVIQSSFTTGNTLKVFSGIIISTLLGFTFYYITVLLENKVSDKWK